MRQIKISQPFFSYKEINATRKVLRSGWITNGPKTLELETLIRNKINSKNVIAVNSCTSGIAASLIAHGAKKGDEIITPANTFISSINTFYNLGLKIKLCDININTFNIDEELLKNCITNKTKFFIPVHNGGSPEHFDKILEISLKKKIKVIDDAAAAFGAKIKNKYIGSYKNSTTVFSLQANKVISSGEGGLICTNDNFLATKIRKIINNGLDKTTWARNPKKLNILNSQLPGYKFNYNDIHAAIALEQFKKFEKIISYRQKLIEGYLKNLKPIIIKNYIQTQFVSKENKSGLYNFQILLKVSNIRNRLIRYLLTKNISSSIHYTPCYEHKFYKNKFKTSHLINTKKIFQNIISLPLHNHLSLREIDKVSYYILKFFEEI